MAVAVQSYCYCTATCGRGSERRDERLIVVYSNSWGTGTKKVKEMGLIPITRPLLLLRRDGGWCVGEAVDKTVLYLLIVPVEAVQVIEKGFRPQGFTLEACYLSLLSREVNKTDWAHPAYGPNCRR